MGFEQMGSNAGDSFLAHSQYSIQIVIKGRPCACR